MLDEPVTRRDYTTEVRSSQSSGGSQWLNNAPQGRFILCDGGSSMRVYLDTCSLQRPLDSKTHIRITLEAEAVLGILTLCEVGKIELIASDALVFEIERNPNMARVEYGLEVLSRARRFVALSERAEKRARDLNAIGLGPLDALHLASAEEGEADCFCTCDDRLLKKAKRVPELHVRVISPIELIEEIEE
jgi:predicted nucleic acid-binding protein